MCFVRKLPKRETSDQKSYRPASRKQTDNQECRQAGGQAGRQAGEQTDEQACRLAAQRIRLNRVADDIPSIILLDVVLCITEFCRIRAVVRLDILAQRTSFSLTEPRSRSPSLVFALIASFSLVEPCLSSTQSLASRVFSRLSRVCSTMSYIKPAL